MDIEPLDLELNESELNPKPDYVDMDRKEREAYLSQIGNFSTEERGIFHMLCSKWEPEIGYAKFVTSANKQHPIEEKELKSLMRKLRKSGCGLLLTKFTRGERGADKIILTDPLTHHFYYYFICNEYQKNFEDVVIDYVDKKNFEKYDVLATELTSIPMNIDDLNKRFIKNEEGKYHIFKIKSDSYSSFYATSDTLKDLLKISVRKVKYYFKSDNFIALVAKIMNSSISRIKSSIGQFDISVWKDLTKTILANKDLINSKFKNVSSSFFMAITITNSYCHSELKQRDEELKAERKLKELLKSIADIIRKNEFTPLTQENFNALFKNPEVSAPEIKSRFYELYVDNKTKIGLTEIVFIGQHYIHQDNLYKVFLDRVAMASSNLSSYYIQELKACLVSGRIDSNLHEGYSFNNSISTKLKGDYPIISDLLKRKSILSESIIHFCKKRGHSQNKLHNLLSEYFVSGSSDLQELNIILNLDIVELYDIAFSSLSMFKRFFIIVFGQYKNNLEKYTGYRSIKKRKSTNFHTGSGRGLNDSYGGGGYSGSRGSLLKESKPSKPKFYNQAEQDNAWDSLHSELNKKK
ncbi:MAG: hypothetical protein B6229_03235 [Spirochaetaceae bacterium 4572_7]|nr:MAG: hypothetical protein B6229_03235 [Spirochaetaceae bacterium 4572_7]